MVLFLVLEAYFQLEQGSKLVGKLNKVTLSLMGTVKNEEGGNF